MVLGDRAGLGIDDLETLHADIAKSFQAFRHTLCCRRPVKGLVEVPFRLGNSITFLDAFQIQLDQYEMISPLVRFPLLQTGYGRKEGTWCAVATWLESKSR